MNKGASVRGPWNLCAAPVIRLSVRRRHGFRAEAAGEPDANAGADAG